MSAIINNVCVNFEVVENQIFTNSLQIAEVFEKRHTDILRAIDTISQDEFAKANFIKGEYKDSTNRTLPLYNLTKDGFMLLVMGFTGAKAYKFKVAFINAFNEMQKELERLRERERVDKIANLEMVQISQNKHFQNVINGYKSQIAQKNEQILQLKNEKSESKKQSVAKYLQFLQHFNYRFLELLQIYSITNDSFETKERLNKFIANCG